MATTINSYSVSLSLDASSYIDASKISRQETASLKRDISAARDPTEKLAVEQDRLTRALESGAISLEVYNRLLEAKRQKLLGAAPAAESLMTRLSEVGNVISGVRHGFDMVGSAISSVMDAWQQFDIIAADLDTAKDKAEKLGLTFNELGSLRFAASRLGGDDAAGALDAAMGKMLKSGFVDAGESAVDAFKRAADEINGMATQTERAQRASEIFGKSGIELLAVLSAGSEEVGALADKWEQTNGLTQTQLEFIGEYNDKFEDVQMVIGGVISMFVVELAPALSLIADEILSMDDGIKGFRDNARFSADVMLAMVGYAKDIYDVYEMISLGPAALLDPAKITEALDFSTADKMLDEVNAKRSAIEDAAAKTQREKELNRIKSIEEAKQTAAEATLEKQRKAEEDSYKELIDGNADAWDKFTADRKEANAMATKSIQEAEKSLENQRKEREKQKQDMAKGPQSIEAGSAAMAAFMAEQVNATIANQVAGDTAAKPTDQQLLDEALVQRELMIQQAEREKAMNEKLGQAVAALQQNGFKRIR